jgi:hypothetical protein
LGQVDDRMAMIAVAVGAFGLASWLLLRAIGPIVGLSLFLTLGYVGARRYGARP